MLSRTTQVGLVSFGFCANPKYPGVYACVTDNIHWILENSDVKNFQGSQYWVSEIYFNWEKTVKVWNNKMIYWNKLWQFTKIMLFEVYYKQAR